MRIWHAAALDLPALDAMGRGTLASHLDIRFVDYGDDWLAAEMPVTSRVQQPFGLLHGGASVALAETVSSVAGTLTLDPAVKFVVGMEINANHIGSARDGIVRAVATSELMGRSSQVWTIRITNDNGKLICLSRATLAVLTRANQTAKDVAT